MRRTVYGFTYSMALIAVLAGPGLAQNVTEDDFGIIDDGVPLKQLLEETGETPLPTPLPYDDGAVPAPQPAPAVTPGPAPAAPQLQATPTASPILDALPEGVAVITYSPPPADWISHEVRGYTFAAPPDWKVVADTDDGLVLFGGDMDTHKGPSFGIMFDRSRPSDEDEANILAQGQAALADGALLDDYTLEQDLGEIVVHLRTLSTPQPDEEGDYTIIMLGQYGWEGVNDPLSEQILASVKSPASNLAAAPKALNGLITYMLPEGWQVEENADHTLLTLRAEPFSRFVEFAIGAGVTGPDGLDLKYADTDVPDQKQFMDVLAGRYVEYNDFGFVNEDGDGYGYIYYYRLNKCLPGGVPVAVAVGDAGNLFEHSDQQRALYSRFVVNWPEGSSDCNIPVAQSKPAPAPQPTPVPAPVVAPPPAPTTPPAPQADATQGLVNVEGVTFRLPKGWQPSLDSPDDKIFESPDGRFTLLAFWWFPDEPLLGNDGEQVAQVIIDHEPVTRISLPKNVRPSIMNVTERARADERRFIFTLELNNGSFDDLQSMHDALVSTLSYSGAFGGNTAPTAASTAQSAPPQSHVAPATSMVSGAGPINVMPWFGDDCVPADMSTWSDSTRQVLETNPAVNLQFVWLCDEKMLRVFGVSLKYDPRGMTDDFFDPLYLDLLNANGRRPFDIFDVPDNLDIGVARDGDTGMYVDIRDIDIGDVAGPKTSSQTPAVPTSPSRDLSGPQGIYIADWGDGQDTPTQFATFASGGVHATYSDGASDGTMSHIDGSMHGTSFVGRWQEPLSGRRCDDNAYWGRMVFEFSADFSTFTGNWGYCDAEPTRSFEGARDGGAPAPAGTVAGLNGIGDSGVTVNFANGTQGWTGEYAKLTARPSGGPNGGGVLEAFTPGDSQDGYLIAPDSLLGDWSGATGLRITVKTEGGTYSDAFDAGAYGDIYLASGEKSAAIAFPIRVGTDWTTEQVSFDDPGWKLNGGAQSVYDVIADLATFRIRAEYANGDVTAWFSSVEILSGGNVGPISNSTDGKPTPIAPRTSAATDPAIELAFWDTVKDSTDPADFQAYLDQYPNGAFSALAKIRIKRYGDGAGPEIPAPTVSGSPAQRLLNDGWWVILGSLPTEPWERQQTDFEKMQSTAAPCNLDVFNDFSSKFKGFTAGYNVFVLGAFESQLAANKKMNQARTCFPDAYVEYGEYLGE